MSWLLKSFRESKRKLVVAFDVGTTYSGISYVVLDPGRVPEIKTVTQFPAQEAVQGSSKIPSIIYYDARGCTMAVGAEALTDGTFERAEDEGWHKAEWFKMHLRPKGMSSSPDIEDEAIPPLPPGKTAAMVLGDYMRYLFQCAQAYITEKEPNGPSLWQSVTDQTDFILTHPNGWEGVQQRQIRTAAVLGGLIPDTQEGHARLSFVTEGEASLHFALRNGFPKDDMGLGEGVLILDAGGGTIDTSTYVKKGTKRYEEVATPQCHFNGSIFVTMAAQAFLREFLAESEFIEDLDHIVQCFDKTTKQRFSNSQEGQYIKFGKTKDNDEEHSIRYGQLKLSGQEVASFFEPAVRCIVKVVTEQQESSGLEYLYVVLVGGFSASNYLYSEVTKQLELQGCQVMRPDNYVSKACSDGAISFYLDHCVQSRVSKYTYGSFANVYYRPDDNDHYSRESSVFVTLAGEKRLPGAFNTVLPRGTKVTEATEFRSSYCQLFQSKEDFRAFTSQVWSYRGDLPEPKWRDVDSDSYVLVCTIKVDVEDILKHAKSYRQKGSKGKFYKLEYDVILLLGLIEFKAQIAWKEKGGVERRSPAKILYDYHRASLDI
ncbi:hypothetical protein D9611_007017 [Ephemerocybe angulata]|uniref:Heat shock 70 kDa protein 12A n=1 Tax=Ephemerocybe angulata TaxID=980116 RepID=A0A8H5B2J4_9AGAR|nr:hypothetical protein D9611_007017 [Tulosesus angulatus]